MSTLIAGPPTTVAQFDRLKHRQPIKGVKDAILPAWSADGSRLAYVQRVGRNRFAVGMLALGR